MEKQIKDEFNGIQEGEILDEEDFEVVEETPDLDLNRLMKEGKRLKGFTIREVIDSDDDDDEEDPESTNAILKSIKTEDVLKRLENKERLIQKRTKGEKKLKDILKYPRNEEGIIVAKPFDYEKLRIIEQRKGIVFLQNPNINSLCTERQIKQYFSRYGKVLRVEKKIFIKENQEEDIIGYYIEFPRKRTAERVVDMVNNKPFSRKYKKNLTLRMEENFNWADLYDGEDKKKIMEKYLKVEVQKELRRIREYKNNAKLSKRIKKNKNKLNTKRFHHQQKKVRSLSQGTKHLNSLKIF